MTTMVPGYHIEATRGERVVTYWTAVPSSLAAAMAAAAAAFPDATRILVEVEERASFDVPFMADLPFSPGSGPDPDGRAARAAGVPLGATSPPRASAESGWLAATGSGREGECHKPETLPSEILL